jgi:probable HAF family extracellular repeat protein
MAVVVTVATASPASAAIVTDDMGTTPGDTFSQATSVRDDGVAVGYSTRPGGGDHALLWDASGVVTELETPGRRSEAHDINDAGVVVGEAESADHEVAYPVRWEVTGAMTRLPGDSTGSARGVNDTGVIVGSTGYYVQSPVRWESASTQPTRLATLPGGRDDGVAYDVNNDGTVVGYSQGSGAIRHAVVWDAAGVVRALDTPPGHRDCFALKINDSGLIVGYCTIGSGSAAVRWDVTGAAAVLPAFGTPEAGATGVSDAGLIVGYALDVDGRTRAVRWGAYGTVTRLATLGGLHGVAMDIDNTGTIVGRTNTADGSFRATSWRNAG